MTIRTSPSDATGPASQRILIVDDDTLLLRLFSRALDRLGVPATLVEDGASALAAAAREQFTLAFIDEHLLAESGTDVAARLRALGPTAPRCISISASHRSAGAGTDGFEGFDAKPATIDQMRAMLERWGAPR